MSLVSAAREVAPGLVARLGEFHRTRRDRKLGRSVSPKMLLLFVGNPRSGTTLTRSLLNAHPAITIAHEFDLLDHFATGHRDWTRAVGALKHKAARFDADPSWSGYSYAVPKIGAEAANDLVVIGDKKAGLSARAMRKDPTLFSAFTNWCPLPVCVIQVVRHPLDVVATFSKMRGFDLTETSMIWQRNEDLGAKVESALGPTRFLRLYLEDLITTPDVELSKIARWLGVDAPRDWLDACGSVIFAAPRQSRNDADFAPELRASLYAHAQSQPHLKRYVPSLNCS